MQRYDPDYDLVDVMDKAQYGSWVRYEDAQAEIASLLDEVDRLRDIAEAKWQSIERAEDDRIWNAALEEAAQECGCLMFYEQQSRYPQWNEACREAAAAIRALKRPTS